MKRRTRNVLLVLAVLGVGAGAIAWPAISEIRAMARPRYEAGEHEGASFCGTCHAEIYREWSESRHAKATPAARFPPAESPATPILA